MQFGDISVVDPYSQQNNKFQSPAVNNAKNQQQINHESSDNRPINAKGMYVIENDDMHEELELEDDLTEKEVAEEESGLMQQVIAGVNNFYS